MDKVELVELLDAAGVPHQSWGTGSAKSVDDLLAEVRKRESILFSEAAGTRLVRIVWVAAANVYYCGGGRACFRLVERKQVLPDGRERSRGCRFSICEKFALPEDPEQAIRRALREELGINPADAAVEHGDLAVEETDRGDSYPGLMSRFIFCQFFVRLGDGSYRPEGYVEHGKLTTHFAWEEETITA
jgi:hypothetical protein